MNESIEVPTKKIAECRFWFIDNEETIIEGLFIDFKNIGLEKCNMTRDYKEILSRANQGEIDVLISDFKMHPKDGITLLEEVYDIDKNIILVLLTGYVLPIQLQNRCHVKGIKYHKKIEDFCSFISNIQKYITQHKPNSEVNLSTELNNLSYLLDTPSVYIGIKNSEFEETKNQFLNKIVFELAQDLISDLEKLKYQDANIYLSEDKKITISELVNEIKKLSPVGIRYLTNWFNAERNLRLNKRKQQ